MSGLDAHERPPQDLKTVFKYYQRITTQQLDHDTNIIDAHGATANARIVRAIETTSLSFRPRFDHERAVSVLEWPDLPGLQFIPGLLTEDVQLDLLSRMLHRDLANPVHQTNLHKHYGIPYHLTLSPDGASHSRSFFHVSPESTESIEPHDSAAHKPLSIKQLLEKKLRWLTLGGQYDWTAKVYPTEPPPVFPSDIAELLQKAFPDMNAEAAIVNVYSPGDTLALHRDVSEISDNGLVSISIGNNAIFIAGLADEDDKTKWKAFRLRSGDAIYMSGPSRYAWHGVPKIFRDTCPKAIQDWPAGNMGFEDWRGWMAGKRINLNVRQMFDG